MLLKCAFATKLFDAYDEYLQRAERVRVAAGLSKAEWKLIGEDRVLDPDLTRRIANAIETLPDLANESKVDLKKFMTSAKDSRASDYG